MILFLWLISYVSQFLSAFSQLRQDQLPVRTIYEFTSPESTENLVERSNGALLVTVLGAPILYETDPRHRQVGRVIHTFSGHQNAYGLVELDQDLYYVLAGNFTGYPDWKGVPGSNALYEVDMREEKPSISKVFDIDEALLIDGMTVINHEQGLLMTGDTQTGELYLLDVNNHQYQVVYQSRYLNQTANDPTNLLDRVGVNGLHFHDGDLFFTTTSQRVFGKLSIDLKTGMPVGEVEVLSELSHHPDDFAIGDDGIAVITQVEHGLVSANTNRLISGQAPIEHLIDLPGANACYWGKTKESKCTLYALYNQATAGVGYGSGLVAVDVRGARLIKGC